MNIYTKSISSGIIFQNSADIAFAAQGNAFTSQECSLQWMAFTKALPCKAISENDNFRKAILVLDDCYNEDNIKTLQR